MVGTQRESAALFSFLGAPILLLSSRGGKHWGRNTFVFQHRQSYYQPGTSSGPGAVLREASHRTARSSSPSITSHLSDQDNQSDCVGGIGGLFCTLGKCVSNTLPKNSGSRVSVNWGTHGLNFPSINLYGRPHGSLSSLARSFIQDLTLASAIESLWAFTAAPYSLRAPSISSTGDHRILLGESPSNHAYIVCIPRVQCIRLLKYA